MAKPGRRSAAENVVRLTTTALRPRLTPPSSLTKAERAIFADVVRENAHLNAADVPLVVIYVQAYSKALALGQQQAAVADWDRATRVMMSAGTKLRLTPQSTQNPQALGRRRLDASPPSYYDTMDDDDGN